MSVSSGRTRAYKKRQNIIKWGRKVFKEPTYKTNEQLSAEYGVSKRTIVNWIAQLKNLGVISISYAIRHNGKTRCITLASETPEFAWVDQIFSYQNVVKFDVKHLVNELKCSKRHLYRIVKRAIESGIIRKDITSVGVFLIREVVEHERWDSAISESEVSFQGDVLPRGEVEHTGTQYTEAMC